MRAHVAACVSLSLALLGCGPTNTSDWSGGGAADAGRADARPSEQEFVDAAMGKPCEKMDIMFVIDNSGSMNQEQENLIANFPEFVRVLDEFETSAGDLLDYRVAVTTTGVDYLAYHPINGTWIVEGDNGAFRGECGGDEPWINGGDSDATSVFSCRAEVGIGGPSVEMPLRAMQLALSDRVEDGTNDGFRRWDSLLGVVILTDEDDCSVEPGGDPINFGAQCDTIEGRVPTQIYVDWLDFHTGARGRWAVAVIAGPGPGPCESELGTATEGVRLQELVAQTGQNAVFSSICTGDLAGSLSAVLSTFESACEGIPPVL